jgi:hypothetical protein
MDQPQWREDLFAAKWAEIDKAVEAARQAKMPARKPDSSLRRLPNRRYARIASSVGPAPETSRKGVMTQDFAVPDDHALPLLHRSAGKGARLTPAGAFRVGSERAAADLVHPGR